MQKVENIFLKVKSIIDVLRKIKMFCSQSKKIIK